MGWTDKYVCFICPSLPDGGMKPAERAKHVILLALSDATGDLDEYFFYFLIPITQYGCDGITYVFGSLLIGKEVISFVSKAFAGWIVDVSSTKVHWTLFLAALGQILTAAIMCFSGEWMNVWELVALWLVHAVFVALTETAMWKAVKMRCEYFYGSDDQESQEQVISWIGINQHIWSNFYETLFLLAVFLMMTFIKPSSDDIFYYCKLLLIISVLLGDLLIVFFSALPVFCFWMGGDLFSNKFAAEAINKEKQQKAEADLLIPKDSSDPTTQMTGRIKKWCINGWEFVKEKVLALWTTRLAIHAIFLAWLLYVFTEIIEYPVTFASAKGTDYVDCDDHPDECSTSNYCGKTLTNLVEVSMYDDIAYTLGAVAYFFFLLRFPAKWFYLVILPLVSIAMCGMIVIFWFMDTFPHTLAFICLSLALVVPTYMERFNFYFWMAVVESQHFGFFYGLYGIGQNALHLVVSTILTLFGDDIKAGSWSFNVLLVIGLAMMGVVMVYSVLFYCLYRKAFEQRLEIAEAKHYKDNEEDAPHIINHGSDEEVSIN
eukprot:CAMPEP_0174256528 /NCGR_PEP_ID=MMETSP0439-20130205/5750_1 /TAXON_ID=0 /ORGANISM="Stereomyxa ramosa, Strain Chinc5" /LENGTH=544 /DNA_ID=CAMNT_0015339169 /DNA_START=1 /DNA_END=1635 /DNA_ORIENTATION=-